MALLKIITTALFKKMDTRQLESHGFKLLDERLARRDSDNAIRYRCDDCRLWVEKVECGGWGDQYCQECSKRL
jgi:hypothetical protein